MKPSTFLFALLYLTARCLSAHATQPQKFLVFDNKLDASWVKAHGKEYVFVWGASQKTMADFAESAPGTKLSVYFPYARDPDPGNDLAHWQTVHPDWIAYKCDQKTAAYFPGGKNVPLDITNPAVVDWQHDLITHHKSATKTVAFDNFQLRNELGVCGVNIGPAFHAYYSGAAADTSFSNSVINWLEEISAKLHESGYRVIVNHIPDERMVGGLKDVDPDSVLTSRMVNAVDGILDEKANLILNNGEVAKDIFRFAQDVQKKGKWLYLLYQMIPLRAQEAQTAIASYLMIAGPKTAISLSYYDRDYGSAPEFFGYDRDVGRPCESYEDDAGLFVRRFSGGIALFVLPGRDPVQVRMPSGYVDVAAQPVLGIVNMDGGQGRVFYRNDNSGCSMHSDVRVKIDVKA